MAICLDRSSNTLRPTLDTWRWMVAEFALTVPWSIGIDTCSARPRSFGVKFRVKFWDRMTTDTSGRPEAVDARISAANRAAFAAPRSSIQFAGNRLDRSGTVNTSVLVCLRSASTP